MRFLDYFAGRSDNCAVQYQGQTGFTRLERGLTDEDMSAHFEQTSCYGFYLMNHNSQVKCSCIDFDNHDNDPDPLWQNKANKTYFFLQELGLDPAMEISQSGDGAHCWLFFDQWLPAWLIRRFWKAVGLKLNINYDEIYPRQDFLSGKGLGNLVRIPYWNKSLFVDPEQDWAAIEFPYPDFTTEDIIQEHCMALGASVVAPEPLGEESDGDIPYTVQKLLDDPYGRLRGKWDKIPEPGFDGDQSGSAWAFYIACELVYKRIHTDAIRKALRVWCIEKGETHRLSQHGWIDKVINDAYDSINQRVGPDSVSESDMLDCAQTFLDRVGKDYYYGSPLSALNQAIDGIGPGEIGIIAARPGHGKSAFALDWLIFQGKLGVNTLFLSAEMSSKQIGKRVVMQEFPDEATWEENRDTIIEHMRAVWEKGHPPFYQPVGTIEEVEKNIKDFVEHKQVKVVIIDYVQLLRASNKNGRYEMVTEISQRITRAARDNDVAILALCQIGREVERRENIQFFDSDLKDSGQLEQDADLILFCWSHAKRNNESDAYEIHITKRRNGPIRSDRVFAKFDTNRQKFYG